MASSHKNTLLLLTQRFVNFQHVPGWIIANVISQVQGVTNARTFLINLHFFVNPDTLLVLSSYFKMKNRYNKTFYILCVQEVKMSMAVVSTSINICIFQNEKSITKS